MSIFHKLQNTGGSSHITLERHCSFEVRLRKLLLLLFRMKGTLSTMKSPKL